MKPFLLILILFGLFSCKEGKNSKAIATTNPKPNSDTTIVKSQNKIDSSYGRQTLSKSYTYYWLTGGDTLDFQLFAHEYHDTSLSISISHKKSPMLFEVALQRIIACLDVMKEDFTLSKLQYISTFSPMYYPDLSKQIAYGYEQRFGRRAVSYEMLNEFMLKTDVNNMLNTFLQPVKKKVRSYGIEKFHVLEKEQFRSYLPIADVSAYPDFVFHGGGFSIRLTEAR